MRLASGGLAPMDSLGWAEGVGGGFSRSVFVEDSITPFRLLGERVLEMREGEWMELYAREASRPACFVMTEGRDYKSDDDVRSGIVRTFIAAGMAWDEVCYIPYDIVYYDPTVVFGRVLLDLFDSYNLFLHIVYQISKRW
jgi:hypothetical protein